MTLFLRLVRNEMEKTWRSRWLVFVILFGIFGLIAAGLYTFYVFHEQRWTPPATVAWQDQLRSEISNDQQEIQTLQQIQQQGTGNGKVDIGPGGQSLDSAIATLQQSITDDQYLIDNNIAPMESFSITTAMIFTFGGIIFFILTRIFGWLASEQIAGERSDRTISTLLSRPPTRTQVLLAKAVSSFVINLIVVVATFVIVYAAVGFLDGSIGPVTGQVGIPHDGSQALTPSNLVVMPIPLVVLMCLAATMLAVLCVQGASLLISAVTGRWAAIGITLALLFAGPLVSSVITVVITLITQDANSASFLNYVFFNALEPVTKLAPAFGNAVSSGPGAQTGMNEFLKNIATLAVWTLVFFGLTFAFFRRKQEAG